MTFRHLRRLRRTPAMRALVSETRVAPVDLILPLFVVTGAGVSMPIREMPGVNRVSPDLAAEIATQCWNANLKAVLLFGIPAHKNPDGKAAFAPNEAVQQACRAIKAAVPDIMVITDVCLCQYTTHGHCGVLNQLGQLDNDATLPLLVQVALSHVDAGADMVAPSAMLDGQVAAIRLALNEARHNNIPIMAYSAKYASAYYGPFRHVADSAPQVGDRKTHQMQPTQSNEAMQEMAADIEEGADWLMVKPALPYLDIIQRATERFDHPIAAYNVSGEYIMAKAAANTGGLDEAQVVLENMTCIKRSGARAIITYHALEIADWIANTP